METILPRYETDCMSKSQCNGTMHMLGLFYYLSGHEQLSMRDWVAHEFQANLSVHT